MNDEPITNGQLIDLLTNLGFTRSPMNERYDLFSESTTRMLFPLPRDAAGEAARSANVDGIRGQLHWRGLMDRADFDAYFARPAATKS